MPAPGDLPNKSPHPGKTTMQNPRLGANLWCKSPGVCGEENKGSIAGETA